ncbi:hypothetical protein JZ751_014300 [Albula glossodonta]|uniref:Uncharacterized protein n=1 Tax=Albula glossodonta TaxID=121402 RepID=A0A8T2NSY9_9TELE|nr:hypothetical protein JZ751_014300 [Albula glossodonta]
MALAARSTFFPCGCTFRAAPRLGMLVVAQGVSRVAPLPLLAVSQRCLSLWQEWRPCFCVKSRLIQEPFCALKGTCDRRRGTERELGGMGATHQCDKSKAGALSGKGKVFGSNYMGNEE